MSECAATAVEIGTGIGDGIALTIGVAEAGKSSTFVESSRERIDDTIEVTCSLETEGNIGDSRDGSTEMPILFTAANVNEADAAGRACRNESFVTAVST